MAYRDTGISPWAKNVRAGKCGRCGTRPPVPGRRSCATCLDETKRAERTATAASLHAPALAPLLGPGQTRDGLTRCPGGCGALLWERDTEHENSCPGRTGAAWYTARRGSQMDGAVPAGVAAWRVNTGGR